MFARATLRGHPIHAMLVVLPLGLYLAGYVALLVFAARGDLFWYRASFDALLTGAALAALAAVFGIVDLVAVPRETRAKAIGVFHAAASLSASVLFAGAGLLMRSAWTSLLRSEASRPLPYGLALFFATLAVVDVIVAGGLGWHLVGKHHVGVSPIPGRTNHIELPERLEHWP